MTAERQRSIVRFAALAAAAVIAVCVVVLFVDDAIARRQASRDERTIAALEQEVQQSAAQSPKLEAERKRVTAGLRARKTRVNRIAIVLIVASALFIGAAKRWLALQQKPRIELSRLVQLKAPEAPAGKKKRSKPPPSAPAAAHEPDLSFVDQIVAKEGRSRESAISILQAIQAHYRYLPDHALKRVCELTEITPAQIVGTSSFYAQFRRTPVGKHLVRVCHGTACHVSGARQITDELRRSLGIPEGAETDAERMFTLEEVACLGCCSLAPVLMVDGHTAGKLTPATAREALDVAEPREPA
jgi:NADH:ubiquinone oxidoreductase subunit E